MISFDYVQNSQFKRYTNRRSTKLFESCYCAATDMLCFYRGCARECKSQSIYFFQFIQYQSSCGYFFAGEKSKKQYIQTYTLECT